MVSGELHPDLLGPERVNGSGERSAGEGSGHRRVLRGSDGHPAFFPIASSPMPDVFAVS
jgi:hypothetical protein